MSDTTRHRFDEETELVPAGPGRWRARIGADWNIGESANGGYALSPVLRAIAGFGPHPDPVSVTTHFLRPTRGGRDAEVTAELVRRGRNVTVGRGTLAQDGEERLMVLAAFGDVTGSVGVEATIDPIPPTVPPVEACVDRTGLEQGVELPIMRRLDVRIHPARAIGGTAAEAVTEGWIRFADGAPPTALALPLFADAFPPAVFTRFGRIGWVPTIELTVHVRRRPAPGWVLARFECDDLVGGRMIETGALWDSTGSLVARSRQLGLVLAR